MTRVGLGDAGTVHKYPDDDTAPTCGAPTFPGNGNSGAFLTGETTVADTDPWNLCEDCFPEQYQEYPENDHWFTVESPRGRERAVVTCDKDDCDFQKRTRDESAAYRAGYTHKRYPDLHAEPDNDTDAVTADTTLNVDVNGSRFDFTVESTRSAGKTVAAQGTMERDGSEGYLVAGPEEAMYFSPKRDSWFPVTEYSEA